MRQVVSRAAIGASISALTAFSLAGCEEDPRRAARCAEDPLPLQSARVPLGETYYLPRISRGEGCGEDLAWRVAAAPDGSAAEVRTSGAQEPRFTPDLAGDYRFRLSGAEEAELAIQALAETPAERFRNHYL